MSRQSLVSEFMTTDVLTFGPDEPALAAMKTMVDRGIDGAPVVDADGAVVGMLSTDDLIVPEGKIHFPIVIELLGVGLTVPRGRRKFDDDLRRSIGNTVADLMHKDTVAIEPDDTLEAAATLLHDRRVSRLPVVGDDGLVGLISRTDILRSVLAEVEAEEAEDFAGEAEADSGDPAETGAGAG
jgi:CBS domain-containing protein